MGHVTRGHRDSGDTAGRNDVVNSDVGRGSDHVFSSFIHTVTVNWYGVVT